MAGMFNFVLIKGVLYWGGLMCLVFVLLSWLFMGEAFDSSVVVFNIVIWGIGGLIFGLVTWYLMGKRYKEK